MSLLYFHGSHFISEQVTACHPQATQPQILPVSSGEMLFLEPSEGILLAKESCPPAIR